MSRRKQINQEQKDTSETTGQSVGEMGSKIIDISLKETFDLKSFEFEFNRIKRAVRQLKLYMVIFTVWMIALFILVNL